MYLYKSDYSLFLLKNEREGVRVKSLSSKSGHIYRYSKNWIGPKKTNGELEIIIDNKNLFYDKKSKKLYIKFYHTLTIIDLNNKSMKSGKFSTSELRSILSKTNSEKGFKLLLKFK